MKLWAVYLFIFLGLVNCGKSNGEEYRLGAILAVTGAASWLGEPQKKTLELQVEQLNAQGGLNGKPLKLFIEDSEGKPEKAVQAFNKLIFKSKVLAVIGPTRSGSSIAVAPLADRHKIPLISLAASDAITKDRNGNTRPFVFALAQKTDDAIQRIYDELLLNGFKKVGIFTGATGFGSDGRKKLKSYGEKYNFDIVVDEVYQASDTDMTPLLIKAKRAKAEVIVNWSILPAQSIVLKNANQLNLQIPMYQSHGFGNIKYVEAGGAASENVIFPGGRLLIAKALKDDHPQKQLMLNYISNYEGHFDEPISTFGGHALDGFNLFCLSLKNAIPKTPQGIRDTIEKQKQFVGTGGVYNFSPQDHNGLTKAAFSLIKIKDGDFSWLKK